MENSDRFWKITINKTVKEIGAAVRGEIVGNPDLLIKHFNSLSSASKDDLSFFGDIKYSNDLKKSHAGACILSEKDLAIMPDGMTAIICENPSFTWARILKDFLPNTIYDEYRSPSAVISPHAKIGDNCFIGPNVVIEAESEIGQNCYFAPGVYIGKGVKIGNSCYFGHSSTVEYSIIGDHFVCHSGARIGKEGFGFARDGTQILKVPQIGSVIIGNDVEVGANSCIDRGAIEDTIIGDNTKIDNLVQIGHNVTIGKNCFICGLAGIAGSSKIGDGVMLGGQAGISGHIEIANNVAVAAGSGVTSGIDKVGTVVGGYPAIEISQWHRQTIMLKNMIKEKNN